MLATTFGQLAHWPMINPGVRMVRYPPTATAQMSGSKDHFDRFEDHTLLKHAILEAYLGSWAFKLLQWRGGGSTVFFVDGFAGAGQDLDRNPGSPLIACRIAQQVRGALSKKPGLERARMKVVAVELKQEYFDSLEKILVAFKNLEPETVYSFRGAIAEHLSAVKELVGDSPTLYFLDPFGVKGLAATSFESMLRGPSNEIFALFSDSGAVRLRGVVHGNDNVEAQLLALRDSPSLFPALDAAEAERVQRQAAERQAARAPTQPAATTSLTSALGSDSWINDLADLSPDEARAEFVLRFVRALVNAGALHVHVIPMRDADGGHKYCLVHASKSRSGWTTMKEAVSTGLNDDSLSATMRTRIMDDLRVPLDAAVALLAAAFPSAEKRWTGKKGKDAGTVRRWLLDETGVFDFQLEEAKAELTRRGWLRRQGRVLVCTLPAASPT